MDSLLPHLLAFPPHPPPKTPLTDHEYHKQITALVDTLNSVSANNLINGVKGGGDLLDILDPALNTLPYLYALLAHINHSSGKQKRNKVSDQYAPGSPLWLKMMGFMQTFDPVQIRYGGNEIQRLIELTILSAQRAEELSSAILPIQCAILRIDPVSSTLTSTHVAFVNLCLEAREYSSALPVIDQDIYFLPAASSKQAETTANPLSPFPCSKHQTAATFITPSSGISSHLVYQDYLLYFLYGAMIYLALKNWNRAQIFLETVVGCPTANAASKIQVEAYKKLLLVGLLRVGKAPAMPKNTNSSASKLLCSLVRPYTSLADVFKDGIENEGSSRKLLAEASAGSSVWQEDSNNGLVAQVIEAYRQFSVQHLAKTYAALTIAEVARLTSPDPDSYEKTGQYVIHLISSGQLDASISNRSEDPKTWVVRFLDSAGKTSNAFSEEHHYDEVINQTQQVQAMMGHIRELDRQMENSKEYVQEMRKAKKASADAPVPDEANPFATTAPFDQDEDMMADLR